MTICIAAIAKQARAIVAVIDTKIANESYSHDLGAMKIRTLINRWSAMYAGLPDTYEKLQRHVNGWLEKRGRPKDIDSMIAGIEAAYDAELEHHINREILSPLGLTRAQLKWVDLRQLGETLFGEIAERMRIASYNRWEDPNRTELVVLGFDGFGDPHLISVSGTGACAEHYGLGYWVIGSGETLARIPARSRNATRNAPPTPPSPSRTAFRGGDRVASTEGRGVDRRPARSGGL